jgi:membrane protein implicated in regulation of membrane protease activity
VLGYFVYRKLSAPAAGATPLNQRGLELLGTNGTVFEALRNGHGKVTLGDTVWLAEGPDLNVGTPIVVTGLRGTVVTVAPR